MKNNFPTAPPPWLVSATSKQAPDALNSISCSDESGRRGDRSQVRFLSFPACPLRTMKKNAVRRGAFLLMPLLLLLSAAAVRAQTPTPLRTPASVDNTDAQAVRAEEATAEIPVPSPTIVPVEPASIIPPNSLPGPGAATLPKIPAAPELEQLNQLFQRTSLGKQADEHRLHVEMSELEVQIRNDQDLHRLRASTDEAHSDLERRHRFRTYYEHYYGKLLRLAQTPELKAYLKTQEASHELVLLQPRVRHGTDEAEATKLAAARAATSATPVATPAQGKVDDILRQ